MRHTVVRTFEFSCIFFFNHFESFLNYAMHVLKNYLSYIYKQFYIAYFRKLYYYLRYVSLCGGFYLHNLISLSLQQM